MKRIFLLGILVSFTLLRAQEIQIKSLQAYAGNDQLALPVVIQSKEAKQNLTIEFDVKAPLEPNLVIEFKFADLNWNPYQNLFLVNQGRNTTQTLWYETIRIPNSGADFHYKDSFPNFDITFPFPGKWIFLIRDSMNKNKIYAQGSFFVVHNSIPIRQNIKREVTDDGRFGRIELNRAFSIDANFILPDSLHPANVTGVEIIENRKIYSPYQIGRINSGVRNYYFDGGRGFTFNARDIRPGNGYRSIDIRDRGRYPSPAANARFEEIDNSEFYSFRRHDLVGGSMIMNYRNENSVYLKAKFRLRLPNEINKKVFITGSFCNWIVLPENELEPENGIYTKEIELKRGEYDYQYVLADLINGKLENIDWYTLEGNFWETDNDYHIFIYYFTPDKGGYNKIMGYKKIRSGGL